MKRERDLPREFVARCKAITAKRARTVIDHVLKKGFITSQELKDTYGYNHPPRAIRDVKENGIPMEMFRITGTDGRSVGAYRFGDPSLARMGHFSGRTILGKELKDALLKRDGAKCSIYLETFPAGQLQIDHRVPFEVSGDDPKKDQDAAEYMLICPSANRAKSWSCEHCENWKTIKDPNICRKCYWASPADYEHIGMRQIRRLDLMWIENETAEYDSIKQSAKEAGKEMTSYVKEILRKLIN
jgi:hypothetical protein